MSNSEKDVNALSEDFDGGEHNDHNAENDESESGYDA